MRAFLPTANAFVLTVHWRSLGMARVSVTSNGVSQGQPRLSAYVLADAKTFSRMSSSPLIALIASRLAVRTRGRTHDELNRKSLGSYHDRPNLCPFTNKLLKGKVSVGDRESNSRHQAGDAANGKLSDGLREPLFQVLQDRRPRVRRGVETCPELAKESQARTEEGVDKLVHPSQLLFRHGTRRRVFDVAEPPRLSGPRCHGWIACHRRLPPQLAGLCILLDVGQARRPQARDL